MPFVVPKRDSDGYTTRHVDKLHIRPPQCL
jgi:hypothetical protein